MGAGLVHRPLGPDDGAAVAGLGLGIERRYDMASELGSRHAPWVGVWDRGRLVAAHRGIFFGPYLHLKGLFVAASHQGGSAGLRAARGMLEHAEHLGARGALAWIEPSKPERALAERLQIAVTGPMVHRFGLPVPGAEDRRTARPGRGELSDRSGPLMADLFGDGVIRWTTDGDRLVLSARPDAPPGRLVAEFGDLARERGMRQIEFPLPAADMGALMAAQAAGARRLSRAIVCLGRRIFSSAMASTCP